MVAGIVKEGTARKKQKKPGKRPFDTADGIPEYRMSS
jgi:hypothetical protein